MGCNCGKKKNPGFSYYSKKRQENIAKNGAVGLTSAPRSKTASEFGKRSSSKDS